MSFIFVIGPSWNNLETLIETINKNNALVSNVKKYYISTNDQNVHKFFTELKNPYIMSDHFYENQGSQTSCFNSIVSGMKMVMNNEKVEDDDEDIVIFTHEDCYVNDMNLFNRAVEQFKTGCDIVCRMYNGRKKGEAIDYYMNDVFFIKKNKIREIFGNTHMKTIYPNSFCENEFSNIIKDFKVVSIPYCEHSTHKDSELGFHHIINYELNGIPFWDKNINLIEYNRNF